MWYESTKEALEISVLNMEQNNILTVLMKLSNVVTLMSYIEQRLIK
jgi:hypothetical protein